MTTSTWLQNKAAIKTLISEMTVLNGFNYDWTYHYKKDLKHPEDIYVVFSTPDGQDPSGERGTVGNNEYEFAREVEFYVYIKSGVGDISLDASTEQVEDMLEAAYDDFLDKFNCTYYDPYCGTGIFEVNQEGMEWVGVKEGEKGADRYAPVKMKILTEFKWRRSRNIT